VWDRSARAVGDVAVMMMKGVDTYGNLSRRDGSYYDHHA
jgi:hypothetical protein